jgi:hypothetical protein
MKETFRAPLMETSPRVDPAYRQTFAGPDEKLIAIVVSQGSPGLPCVLDVAQGWSHAELPTRWVVVGSLPPAMLNFRQKTRFGAASIHFIESWGKRLLPGILSVSDTVLVLSQETISLDEILGATQPQARILLDSAIAAGAPHPRRVSIFDVREPDSIAEALKRTLLDPSPGEMSASSKDPFPSMPTEANIPEERGETKAKLPPDQSPLRSQGKTKTRNFILQNDWGIGDELLLSAVAREILRAWPDVKIWIRSRYGFRFPSWVRSDPPPRDAQAVDTIYQNAVLYGPAHHSPFPGPLVQQMLDKFFLDTGLHVVARDLRPELASLAAPAPSRDPGTVVLHSRPNPRLPSKDWGMERWKALVAILHERGLILRQVGGADEPLLPHAEDFRGMPMGPLEDLVSRSSVVVCLVGFLMHLAAATRSRALVIYGGREHPAIDGYPDQVALSSGPLPCRGRWGCHLAPDVQCAHGMKCMDELTPELLAGEVMELVGTTLVGTGT